jgi:hypothetical protein
MRCALYGDLNTFVITSSDKGKYLEERLRENKKPILDSVTSGNPAVPVRQYIISALDKIS